MSAGTPAGRYHGMLQILHYNWPMYLQAGAASLAVILATVLLPVPRPLAALALAGVAAVLLWSISSLVSHWVYDRSGLGRWDWLAGLFPEPPRRWTSVHAGLDETFGALKRVFSDGNGTVLDVYDAAEMTEPSIVRARKLSLDASATAADFRSLPLDGASQDAVFLIFAAHELRRPGRPRRASPGRPELPRLRSGVPALPAPARVAAPGRGGGPRRAPGLPHHPVRGRLRAGENRVSLETHLRIAGALLLLLAAAHPFFPKQLGWKEDLAKLTLLNRQIFLVHVGFIVLILVLFGALALFFSSPPI